MAEDDIVAEPRYLRQTWQSWEVKVVRFDIDMGIPHFQNTTVSLILFKSYQGTYTGKAGGDDGVQREDSYSLEKYIIDVGLLSRIWPITLESSS